MENKTVPPHKYRVLIIGGKRHICHKTQGWTIGLPKGFENNDLLGIVLADIEYTFEKFGIE